MLDPQGSCCMRPRPPPAPPRRPAPRWRTPRPEEPHRSGDIRFSLCSAQCEQFTPGFRSYSVVVFSNVAIGYNPTRRRRERTTRGRWRSPSARSSARRRARLHLPQSSPRIELRRRSRSPTPAAGPPRSSTRRLLTATTRGAPSQTMSTPRPRSRLARCWRPAKYLKQ